MENIKKCVEKKNKYVGNIKEYLENMSEYEEICGKYEGIPLSYGLWDLEKFQNLAFPLHRFWHSI